MIDKTIFRKWKGEARAKYLEDSTNKELLECLEKHLMSINAELGDLILDGHDGYKELDTETYKCRDIVLILRRRIG